MGNCDEGLHYSLGVFIQIDIMLMQPFVSNNMAAHCNRSFIVKLKLFEDGIFTGHGLVTILKPVKCLENLSKKTCLLTN